MPGRAAPAAACIPESSVAMAVILAGVVGLGSAGIKRIPPCVELSKRRYGVARPSPSLGGLLGRPAVPALAATRLRELATLPGGTRRLLFACWHAGILHEGLRRESGCHNASRLDGPCGFATGTSGSKLACWKLPPRWTGFDCGPGYPMRVPLLSPLILSWRLPCCRLCSRRGSRGRPGAASLA